MNVKETARLTLGFLAGGAVGALVGILYAPDKGKNTRDKVSYQLVRVRERLNQLVDELGDKDGMPESIAKTEGEALTNKTREQARRLMEEVDAFIQSNIKQNAARNN